MTPSQRCQGGLLEKHWEISAGSGVLSWQESLENGVLGHHQVTFQLLWVLRQQKPGGLLRNQGSKIDYSVSPLCQVSGMEDAYWVEQKQYFMA